MFRRSNRYTAIVSTTILAVASMVGIPLKSTVKQLHDVVDPTCEAPSPNYWTPYMSKTYARGFMAIEYPSWVEQSGERCSNYGVKSQHGNMMRITPTPAHTA